MSRKAAALDARLLLDVRGKPITAMRGIDHKFQPRTPRNIYSTMLDGPVACRHGIDWTKCTACSTRRSP